MDLQEIMLNAQENEDDIEKQSFSDDMVRGIKLYGIDIEESDFNSCRFRECEFEKVYFKNVSFKGCDLSNICLGTSLEIKVDGEVCCTEVNREMLDGTCLSTILCNYPVKFIDPCATGCECETPYIKQNFTSLHTVNLACTGNSVLDFQNSRILALSAIVTHIDTDYIVVAVIIGARVCLRQTVVQEHCVTVFPSNTIPCAERTRPDTDCTNCAGTATDTIVSVPVPYRGISTYFGG